MAVVDADVDVLVDVNVVVEVVGLLVVEVLSHGLAMVTPRDSSHNEGLSAHIASIIAVLHCHSSKKQSPSTSIFGLQYNPGGQK